jgi:sirohydrochlorin cobaltochelatase
MVERGGLRPGLGILVVGHGTADPVGEAETRRLVGLVAEACPGIPVELGFLEVIAPSVGEALERLRLRGVERVVAAPLLLFTAGHARRDLPEALAAGAGAMQVIQSAALGSHPEIVRLSRRRREEARRVLPPLDPGQEALVFVGRGASDPGAAGQMQAFVRATIACASAGALCRPGVPAASCGVRDRPAVCAAPPAPPGPGREMVGFVAAARPSVAEALEAVVDPMQPGPVPRRVFVQPHLLFRGRVEEQVESAIELARARHPAIEWAVVPRLGAEPEVARALVARALEATEFGGNGDAFSRQQPDRGAGIPANEG